MGKTAAIGSRETSGHSDAAVGALEVHPVFYGDLRGSIRLLHHNPGQKGQPVPWGLWPTLANEPTDNEADGHTDPEKSVGGRGEFHCRH